MRGWRLFRLGGVDVNLDPSLFLVLALLGYIPSESPRDNLRHVLVWVPVAAVCILVHELGHALAFRGFGRPASVLLYGMGGLTSSGGAKPLHPLSSLVVSLAGPLAGFGLGGAVLLLGAPDGGLARLAFYDALFACFGFGILNLLPILPLDGGQSVLSVIRTVKREGAERLAHQLSVGVAGVGVVIGLNFGQLFAALIGGMFIFQNLAALKELRDDPARSRLEAALELLLGGRYADAAQEARGVLAGRPGFDLADLASETLAWAELGRGDVTAARQALSERRPTTPNGPAPRLVEAAVALAEGAAAEAAVVAAAALDAGEWGPPGVLLPLLDRQDVRPWLEASLGDSGRARLAGLRGASS